MNGRRAEAHQSCDTLLELLDLSIPMWLQSRYIEWLSQGNVSLLTVEPKIPAAKRGVVDVDHHRRVLGDDDRLFSVGFCSASSIALWLILNRTLRKDVRVAAIDHTADVDQWLATTLIHIWSSTGNMGEVVRFWEKHSEELLKEEFWMLPSGEALKLSNKGALVPPEFEDRRSKATRYEKPGLPTLLQLEVFSSKDAFGPHTQYQDYMRQLAIATGVTTENCIAYVLSHFQAQSRRSARCSATLGVLGSYDGTATLTQEGALLGNTFSRVLKELRCQGFSTTHQSSRNLLTLVLPTDRSARMCEDERYESQTTVGGKRYTSLELAIERAAENLGYKPAQVAYVGNA